MKKTILITGKNGLIAKSLTDKLKAYGYTIKSLSRKKTNEPNVYYWDVNNNKIDLKAFENIDGIVHLAGANIGEKRWTDKRKQELYNSRIKSTNLLYESVKKLNLKLEFFISASAIGYYGTFTSSTVFTEEMPADNDFLANLCVDWEKEALKFEQLGARVVRLRTGVVFAKNDGAFLKLSKPVKYGIGAALGSGTQIIPWVHIDDIVNAYVFAIENELNGAYNIVAHEQVTNKELTEKIAKFYHRPLIFPNIPAFLLRLMFGEMSGIILEGSPIDNQTIKKAGFRFKYDNLCKALNNLINDC